MQEFIEFMSRHPLLVGATVVLGVATVYAFIKHSLSRVQVISPQETTLMLNSYSAELIDVREVSSFAKKHIKNSKNIPFSKIKSDNAGFISKNYENKSIIFICDTDQQAKMAAGFLEKSKNITIYVMKGGIQQWESNHFPLTKK